MKHLVITVIFLLAGLTAFSQDGNVRFVHFDQYSVEQDKLVQEALKSEKVVYTCIPSGIIAIEVSPTDPTAEQRIANLIADAAGSASFSFIPISMQEAESKCAEQRKTE